MTTLELYIPVYMEEDRIEAALHGIAQALPKEFDCNVIVVDDGSTDDTAKKAIDAGKKQQQTLAVRQYLDGPSRRENLGKAMMESKADYVACMDMDWPNPHNLQDMAGLAGHFDVVLASRYTCGATAKRSLYRLCVSRAYNMFWRNILQSGIQDANAGLKVFKREAFQNIMSHVGVDETHRRGWLWDREVAWTAESLGLRILEYPVEWVEGDKTSVRILREIKLIPYFLVNLHRYLTIRFLKKWRTKT